MMPRSSATTIRLASYGQLVLVLQDKTGAEVEILLAEGHEAEILKSILKAQQTPVTSHQPSASRGSEEIGQLAGPTWRFLLENGLLQSQITRAPATSRHLTETRKLETSLSAEELGL